MKAVILEICGKNAAALTDDGSVMKLSNQNYTVGQVIEVKANGSRRRKIISRAASIAAVFAFTSITAFAYYTPTSYVSLDVNPSIEYSLNRFDCVLSCTAINGDGEKILEHLQLKNKNIKNAIEMTVLEIAAEGFLSGEEATDMIVTASCQDRSKSDELTKSIQEAAKVAAKEAQIKVEVKAESVGKERVQEAKELGITPGKLNLMQKLEESAGNDSKIDVKEWSDKSVKDIMKQIRENKQAAKETKPATKKQTKEKDQSQANSTNKTNQNQNQNRNQNNKETKTAAKKGTGKNHKASTSSQNKKNKNNTSNAKIKK